MLSYLMLELQLLKARFFGEEKGAVDLVVIIIIIAVAVALVVIFRNKLKELINTLFDSIFTSSNEAINN